MPRRRPEPKKRPQREQIALFANKVEQATPEWFAQYERRRDALESSFWELQESLGTTEDPKLKLEVLKGLAGLHQQICKGDAQLFRVTCVKEQLAQEKGVGPRSQPLAPKEVHNHLHLSGMTPEQKVEHALATLQGRVLPAPAEVVPVQTAEVA